MPNEAAERPKAIESQDIASSSSLCSTCLQINFDALRSPPETVLRRIIAGRTESSVQTIVAQLKDGTSSDKVVLGPLANIRSRASICALCSMFLDIIMSQEAVYLGPDGFESLDNEAIYFRADPDMSYYAKILGQNKKQNLYFVLKRLCITAERDETSLAYFDYALQTCHPGQLTSKFKPMQFGGRKRTEAINVNLIKEWMMLCQDGHKTCSTDSQKKMATFRLIDVERGLIVVFEEVVLADLRYAALSYVWGGPQELMLKQSTYEELLTPGILVRKLPMTIHDAVELVGAIGLRYLWVDSLCIVQDSDDDKAQQINCMADIYASSFLTIVAASGKSANSGLPGVSSPRTAPQSEVVVADDLSLMNTLRDYPAHYDEWFRRGKEPIDFGVWSSRGWCLQEAALSRRKLTFTQQQVYWTCGTCYFCEESYFEVPDIQVELFLPSAHKLNLHQDLTNTTDKWQVYSNLVDNYTRRNLTVEGDVADAFSAVFRAFERTAKTDFFWGLPVSLFELGLMWKTDHGVVRRTAISTLPTETGEKTGFPSWSWLGWKGQCRCPLTEQARETNRPSIFCFVKVGRAVNVVSKSSDVWTKDDIDSRQVMLADIQKQFATLDHPPRYTLFFWTQRAFFPVSHPRANLPIQIHVYGNSPFPHIIDDSGIVGDLCRTREHNSEYDGVKRLEFIEMGRCEDPDLGPDIFPPKVLVLQIERDKHGMAFRVNCGDIALSAWEAAGPEQCLIALA